MTLKTYIKDRIGEMVGLGVTVFAEAIILVVTGAAIWVTAVVIALTILGKLIPMVLDFKKRTLFFENLADAMVNAKYPYQITEALQRPQFIDGEMLYDCLDRSMRAVKETLLISEKTDYSLQHMIVSATQDYAPLLQQRGMAVAAKNLEHTVYTDDVIFIEIIRLQLSFALSYGGEGTCLKFSAMENNGNVRMVTEFTGLEFDVDAQEILMISKLCKALGLSLTRISDESTELVMEFPKKGITRRKSVNI